MRSPRQAKRQHAKHYQRFRRRCRQKIGAGFLESFDEAWGATPQPDRFNVLRGWAARYRVLPGKALTTKLETLRRGMR